MAKPKDSAAQHLQECVWPAPVLDLGLGCGLCSCPVHAVPLGDERRKFRRDPVLPAAALFRSGMRHARAEICLDRFDRGRAAAATCAADISAFQAAIAHRARICGRVREDASANQLPARGAATPRGTPAAAGAVAATHGTNRVVIPARYSDFIIMQFPLDRCLRRIVSIRNTRESWRNGVGSPDSSPDPGTISVQINFPSPMIVFCETQS